jgi:transposase
MRTITRRWFVGVDWATVEHFVCLTDGEGKILGERTFANTGDGIAEVCAWLFDKTGATDASEFAVAIETTRGAVVETMLERGMAVYSINPQQLANFRNRRTNAKAKDDRRDARTLAFSLRTDGDCYRELGVDNPIVIQLRQATRRVADVKDARVQASNRFWDLLVRYYPQILELAGNDITHNSFLDLWELVPTPAKAARVHLSTIEKFLKKARIRRMTAAHVLATLRQDPLRVAEGTVEALTDHIAMLVQQLRLFNRQLAEAESKCDELIEALRKENKKQRDVDILRSLPGVGKMVLATLLAEAQQPLGARDYHAIRKLSGVAPVTQSSGKRKGQKAAILMRQACSHRLRDATYHWAINAMKRDPKSRAVYARLKARGQSHGRSLRGVGDRLLSLACVLLRSQSLYDSERRALIRKSV